MLCVRQAKFSDIAHVTYMEYKNMLIDYPACS